MTSASRLLVLETTRSALVAQTVTGMLNAECVAAVVQDCEENDPLSWTQRAMGTRGCTILVPSDQLDRAKRMLDDWKRCGALEAAAVRRPRGSRSARKPSALRTTRGAAPKKKTRKAAATKRDGGAKSVKSPTRARKVLSKDKPTASGPGSRSNQSRGSKKVR